jgi:hypothetical protein
VPHNTEYRLHNMVRTVKTVKLIIAKTGGFKQSVGRAGEDFVCAHIPCESCGHKKWTNLNNVNHNFPGVDLQCMRCGTYAQVKTMRTPLTLCRNGRSWKFPTSSSTVRDTLKLHKGKVRYISVTYNANHHVTEVCVTEPLSCKNIFHTEGFIVSDNIMQYTPKI